MKRLVLFVVAAIFLSGMVLQAQPAIPHKISYQGVLTNAAGVPLEGAQSVTFSLFGQETGGEAIWTEVTEVTCNQGVFDVLLGNNVPIDVQIDGPVWLQITLGGEALLPRTPLASVPFAFTAQSVLPGAISKENLAPLASVGYAALVWNGSEWVEQPFVVGPSLQTSYDNGNTINETNESIQIFSNTGLAESALEAQFRVNEVTEERSALEAELFSVNMPRSSSVHGGVGTFAPCAEKHFYAGASGTASTLLETASGFVGTLVDGAPYAGYFNGKVYVNGWLGINTTTEPQYALDVNGDISAYNVHTNLIDVENGSIFSNEIIATGNIVTSGGKIAIGKEEPITELDVVGNASVSGQISSATFSTGQMSATNLLVDNSFAAMNFLGVKTIEQTSNLNVQGSVGLKVTNVDADVTLTIDDNVVIANSATNITITLPSAATCVGRVYTVKNLNATGIVTIATTAPDVIENAIASMQLLFGDPNYWGCVTYISDGTRWAIISKF